MVCKKILMLLPTLFGALCLCAQSFIPEADTVGRRLSVQLSMYPQEKVYVSTDKGYYMAGDTIRLRAHVVDAATHRPLTVSKYVYVDFAGGTVTEGRITALRSEKRTVAAEPVRVKLINTDGIYEGYVPIPMTASEGDYTLSAYTWFMLNQGEDYVFRKGIYVAPYGRPYAKPAPDTRKDRDYEVSFFPEGGYLVAGNGCTVGFKALGKNGRSSPVSGAVVDQKGDTAAVFRSLHAGMGAFRFVPRAGNAYFAECVNDLGLRRRFRLPDARDDAAVLSVSAKNGVLNVSVVRGRGVPSGRELYVMLQCRGNLLYFAPWKDRDGFISFEERRFPTGVIQILLFDDAGNTLSERLYFAMNEADMVSALSAVPGKPSYSRRDNLGVDLRLTDGEGRPLEGAFSVSVTDDRMVDVRTPQNILTGLLLESDLRGFVEDPEYYFASGVPGARESLDALMLTQGWRRYDIPSVMCGRYAEPSEPLEVGQSISGRVEQYGLFANRGYGDCEVQLVVPRYNFVTIVKPDSLGNFIAGGFDFPDGTQYIVRAVRENGKGQRLELTLGRDKPDVSVTPVPAADIRNNLELFDRHVGEFSDSLNNILLEEFVVTARREEIAESPYEFYSIRSVDYKQIEEGVYGSLSDLLTHIPGIVINDKAVTFYGRPCKFIVDGVLQEDTVPQDDLVIKGSMEFNTDRSITMLESLMKWDFNTIPVDMIGQVDMIPPYMSGIFGARVGFSPVISITSKDRNAMLATPKIDEHPNIKTVRPFGYQKPIEFYMPRYDTPRRKAAPEKDLRTTLYWNPAMKFDGGGTAALHFTTADTPSDYTVLVEGVTAEGRIVRASAAIVRDRR